jgi:hydrogenase maturation protease
VPLHQFRPVRGTALAQRERGKRLASSEGINLTDTGTRAVRRDGAITVAAAGNWIISCDRVGPRVLKEVERLAPPGVDLADVGMSGLALLDHLHAQQLLVVVDACVGHGLPGEVLVEKLNILAPFGRESSVHQIGPREALAVASHLYPEEMPERIRLVLIETGGLDESMEDDAVRRAAGAVMDEIELFRCRALAPDRELPSDAAAARR